LKKVESNIVGMKYEMLILDELIREDKITIEGIDKQIQEMEERIRLINPTYFIKN